MRTRGKKKKKSKGKKVIVTCSKEVPYTPDDCSSSTVSGIIIDELGSLDFSGTFHARKLEKCVKA